MTVMIMICSQMNQYPPPHTHTPSGRGAISQENMGGGHLNDLSVPPARRNQGTDSG